MTTILDFKKDEYGYQIKVVVEGGALSRLEALKEAAKTIRQEIIRTENRRGDR